MDDEAAKRRRLNEGAEPSGRGDVEAKPEPRSAPTGTAAGGTDGLGGGGAPGTAEGAAGAAAGAEGDAGGGGADGKGGAYAQREEWLTKQEDSGEIRFEPIWNDNDTTHMIWLIDLKNIYSKQLPNMPKEYIVRLVMDRNHRSMVLVKGTARPQVIGGITYRPYYRQKFGEIAFCAIMSTEQVKGYGTRLMNHLKDYATNSEKITHFLTYADNNAVGYFAKQGFTKELMLEREKWVGYIKDYDGGTLMECAINNTINYTNFSEMIRQQREAVDAKMREMSNAHLVYPGLDIWQKNPGRAVPVDEIPGVKEAGWEPENSAHKFKLVTEQGKASSRESLHNFMYDVYRQIMDHADSWPFTAPVDGKEVVDYYDIIKDPVDLTLVDSRLRSGQYYITLEIFAADFKRMFNNCRTYNAPDTIYYKCANRLEAFFEGTLQANLTLAGK